MTLSHHRNKRSLRQKTLRFPDGRHQIPHGRAQRLRMVTANFQKGCDVLQGVKAIGRGGLESNR